MPSVLGPRRHPNHGRWSNHFPLPARTSLLPTLRRYYAAVPWLLKVPFPTTADALETQETRTLTMARCEECNRKVDQPSRHLVNGRILCGIHDPRPPHERQTREVPRERPSGPRRPAPPAPSGAPASTAEPGA
jgi:hypothetical protein